MKIQEKLASGIFMVVRFFCSRSDSESLQDKLHLGSKLFENNKLYHRALYSHTLLFIKKEGILLWGEFGGMGGGEVVARASPGAITVYHSNSEPSR